MVRCGRNGPRLAPHHPGRLEAAHHALEETASTHPPGRRGPAPPPARGVRWAAAGSRRRGRSPPACGRHRRHDRGRRRGRAGPTSPMKARVTCSWSGRSRRRSGDAGRAAWAARTCDQQVVRERHGHEEPHSCVRGLRRSHLRPLSRPVPPRLTSGRRPGTVGGSGARVASACAVQNDHPRRVGRKRQPCTAELGPRLDEVVDPADDREHDGHRQQVGRHGVTRKTPARLEDDREDGEHLAGGLDLAPPAGRE